MMRNDLVFGAASGYTFDQIKLWTNSLDRSGFAGDKVVIVGNGDADLVRELLQRGYRILHTFPSEHPFVDHDMSIERFRLMWHFLGSCPDAYRYAISVDIRDAVFQCDPSRWLEEHLTDKKLLVGGEGFRYEDQEWNRESMREAFGPVLSARMAREVVWNAGALAGEAAVFRDLCLNVYLCCMGRNVPYSDQAALNVLLSLDPYRGMTRFDDGDLGWACQCATMVAGGRSPDTVGKYVGTVPVLDGDIVRTKSGRVFCVVHQYDRIPEWTTRLQAKFS